MTGREGTTSVVTPRAKNALTTTSKAPAVNNGTIECLICTMLPAVNGSTRLPEFGRYAELGHGTASDVACIRQQLGLTNDRS
jgi:hypothetical protein